MRDLKLKCWDKKNKRWYRLPTWDKADPSGNSSVDGVMELISDEDFEWVECTDHEDKNKTEIYSGDVVSYRKNGPKLVVRHGYYDMIYETDCGDRYNDYTHTFHLYGYYVGDSKNATPLSKIASEVTIRGNIYENPELLEK